MYGTSELYKETGRIDGPHLVWRALLLMPFVAFWLTVLVAPFTPHTGAAMLAGVILIFWFVNSQTHRMNHVCRWPNPIHAGMFAGGILSTILVFFVNMFSGTSRFCL